jgi:hypothetical protein
MRTVGNQNNFNSALVLASLGLAAQQTPASYRTYFPTPRGLLLPDRADFQAVAADVDNDGDEDKLSIQSLPLTVAAGVSVATGASTELTIEPQRLCKIQAFDFSDALADGFAITAFEVGVENLLPAKGAVPCTKWKAAGQNKKFDAPWCGPGVPVTITFKNITAGTLVLFGSAEVVAVVG